MQRHQPRRRISWFSGTAHPKRRRHFRHQLRFQPVQVHSSTLYFLLLDCFVTFGDNANRICNFNIWRRYYHTLISLLLKRLWCEYVMMSGNAWWWYQEFGSSNFNIQFVNLHILIEKFLRPLPFEIILSLFLLKKSMFMQFIFLNILNLVLKEKACAGSMWRTRQDSKENTWLRC